MAGTECSLVALVGQMWIRGLDERLPYDGFAVVYQSLLSFASQLRRRVPEKLSFF